MMTHRWISLFAVCTLALLLVTGCGDAQPADTMAQRSTSVPTLTSPTLTLPSPLPTTKPTNVVRASPTPSPEPPLTGLSDGALQDIAPNELGWIPVLQYHLIEAPDDIYARAPESFKRDLERMYALNFYPITFRDLATGTINVPAGKSPMVLTFDDSSDGQFRYLPDGTVDPTSAWGILTAFAEQHPDFPPVATFFPLIDVDVPERVLFGQPDHIAQKLTTILAAGGEIGSHTYTHMNLQEADAEQIRWQLAHSARVLEEYIGTDYRVTSLSLPFGLYPDDESVLVQGESEGTTYGYSAAAEVAGGASISPFAEGFDPLHIDRIQAITADMDYWVEFFQTNPEVKFVSDGDPLIVTVPDEAALPESLQGTLETTDPLLTVRRYAPVKK